MTRERIPGGCAYRNARGALHREDGPAIEWDNGDREYYRDGLLHRENGPAIERADGTKLFYYQGLIYESGQLPNQTSNHHHHYQETKGNNIMSIKDLAKEVAAQMLEGAKLAASNEFNELAADLIIEGAKAMDIPEEVLNSDTGRKIMKFIAPICLMALTEYFPGFVPGAAIIHEGSKKAIAVNSMTVVGPMLEKMRPQFKRLEVAAQELDAAHKAALPEPTADIFDKSMVQEKVAEKVKA